MIHATVEFIEYITGAFPKKAADCSHPASGLDLICNSPRRGQDWVLACEVRSESGNLHDESRKITCPKCIKIMKEKGL